MKISIADNLKYADAISRRDAALLLSFVLGRDKTFLLAHDDYLLTEDEQKQFDAAILRRADGAPVQHITGRQEFYGLEFEVNENVLIPRPETEILVETAVEILRGREKQIFCDVGIGSGCITVSILHTLKNARAVALDISTAALTVAKRNAAKHLVNDRIEFYESDVFDALSGRQFDLIVSNPPYIPQEDSAGLPAEVRDFEPHAALFGGADGTEIIRRLLADAPQFLNENGFLLFEFGFGQSEIVREMIDERVWKFCEILADLAAIPRVVVLQRI